MDEEIDTIAFASYRQRLVYPIQLLSGYGTQPKLKSFISVHAHHLRIIFLKISISGPILPPIKSH